MTQNCSGLVRIVSIPSGESPLWVRACWVGQVVPVIQKTTINDEEVFIVSQLKALQCLESRRAVAWWKDQGFPLAKPDDCFAFKVTDVVVIGKIEYIPLHVRQFHGLEEVGVGAHDHPSNQ
jgi:hypothetical protein